MFSVIIRIIAERGNYTVREYLYQLLLKMWNEKEGFDGKRPFGSSGWEHDIYKALIDGEYISGRFADDGELSGFSKSEADEFVQSLIRCVFYPESKNARLTEVKATIDDVDAPPSNDEAWLAVPLTGEAMDKNSETIVNLTIGDYVIPCKITEKPDFDSDSDEPIELKWRLSCEVDDAGYKVFSQAYYKGTFCSLGVATTRGILEDLDFLKADKGSAISVDFTFRRLAMMRSPRIK